MLTRQLNVIKLKSKQCYTIVQEASTRAKLLNVSLWLILIEVGIFPHTHNGFFCQDRAINFPFTGDTVTTVVIILSVFVPFFIIWVTEAIFVEVNSIKTSRLKESFTGTLRWFREYTVGMVVKLFIVDGLKVTVGELRPHFLDTCRPNTGFNCTEGQFITEYECTNTIDSNFFVRDASKSFPSGHSSISFFEAIFLILYFQFRCPKIRSQFMIPFIQMMLLLWACFCSISRITDRRHHWWDVLTGAFLGVLFAILTVVVLCKNFRKKSKHTVTVNNHHNGNTITYHNSVRRLISDNNKEDVTMNRVTFP